MRKRKLRKWRIANANKSRVDVGGCKTGGKLLLITNRKSHMGFRLVLKSVTLNDLERCNSPNLCIISPNSVAFRTDYVKVVEDTPILSAAEM